MLKYEHDLHKQTDIKVTSIEFVGKGLKYVKIVLDNVASEETLSVFDNKKQIDFNERILTDKGKIEIEIAIKKDSKLIVLLCGSANKKIVLARIKISFLKKVSIRIEKLLSIIKRAVIVSGRGVRYLWREHHLLIPPTLWKKYSMQFIRRVKERGEILWNPFVQKEYLKWVNECEEFSNTKKLDYLPLFSVVIPVYNVKGKLLEECLESILSQTYQNYEICIVDDGSTNIETKQILKKFEEYENIHIAYRKENGHISVATNDAIKMAKGEYICLMDNDDTLAPQALYENAVILNTDSSLDFLYSDEDKLDIYGNRCDPHFKSDYAPDTLLGINYICHFSVIRKTLIDEIGGFRKGYEGAQDHDLFLRLVEKTNKIYHIPKILYHWRIVEGSTAMDIGSKGYAIKNAEKAIVEAIQRRGSTAKIRNVLDSTVFKIQYTVETYPKVSIIIPTRDVADMTRRCLESIYKKTSYEKYEIILVDNNSKTEEALQLFKEYKQKHQNFKVVKADMDFNYSRINNLGIQSATGDVIVLLNNDTEVITPNWLEIMVGYATRPHIGAVGAKLLYPDYTIQHAGVLLGLGEGVGSHAFLNYDRNEPGIYGRLCIPHNYSAVTAACLVVEKKKFLEVEGLEEELKVAYNDIDFNLKLRKAGYYNICLPQVELLHYESKSRGLDTTSEKYKLFLKESNYMYDKWGAILDKDPYYNQNFSVKGLYLLDRKKNGA